MQATWEGKLGITREKQKGGINYASSLFSCLHTNQHFFFHLNRKDKRRRRLGHAEQLQEFLFKDLAYMEIYGCNYQTEHLLINASSFNPSM